MFWFNRKIEGKVRESRECVDKKLSFCDESKGMMNFIMKLQIYRTLGFLTFY